MHKRNIIKKIQTALSDTPVILLNGARQTGKSTLVKTLIANTDNVSYYTLDDIGTLAAMQSDLTGFISKQNGFTVIDEVQKIPDLFSAIKLAVDNDRKPGRFLLTGSANVLLLPKISESLAGRMEIISLWPFSQGEIADSCDTFVDYIFAKEITALKFFPLSREKLLTRILAGGYPEVLTRVTNVRRQDWFAAYITAILQRDVKDIANIDSLVVMPKLLKLLATRASALLNYADVSRASTIPHSTLTRYLALLQATFLIYIVSSWSNNLGKRLVKMPKLFFNDTGLLSYLLGIDQVGVKANPYFIGALLENFVVTELMKQLTWNETRAELFHYRTQAGSEIDVILENRAGQIVGLEIKASSTITAKDFQHLKSLADDLKDRFLRGIVLYTGDQILPFGKNLYAMPVSALWSSDSMGKFNLY